MAYPTCSLVKKLPGTGRSNERNGGGDLAVKQRGVNRREVTKFLSLVFLGHMRVAAISRSRKLGAASSLLMCKEGCSIARTADLEIPPHVGSLTLQESCAAKRAKFGLLGTA
jgi:N-acetylmuramic acid 6-phosphate (MurNAc-6-P) etherase